MPAIGAPRGPGRQCGYIRMKIWLLLILAVLNIITPLGFAADSNLAPRSQQRSSARSSIRQGTLQDGDVAPDFSLQDIEGKKTVRLSELKGKPVVLIFGSCTCPPFVASTRTTDVRSEERRVGKECRSRW